MNCKLTHDIVLSASNSCIPNIGVGGIRKVYVYNIEDIDNLVFSGDGRANDELFVETISTKEPFFSVVFSSTLFNETYNEGKWIHSLQLTTGNLPYVFEQTLSDATNGSYLVCFQPNGDEVFRAFGWKEGASLSYSVELGDNTKGYTITFEDESEYPLFAVDKNNFDLSTKRYNAIFYPDYSDYICELSGGSKTGRLIAKYVPCVNAAGQALDVNRQLCEYSGLNQAAYKFADVVSDGGYQILGTYGKTATYDGYPVSYVDTKKCNDGYSGTITTNINSLTFDSSSMSGTVVVTSDNDWSLLPYDDNLVNVMPSMGDSGVTNVTILSNGNGGEGELVFQNNETLETVSVNIYAYFIKFSSPTYTYPAGTQTIVLNPIIEGGDGDYSYTITPSTGVTVTKNLEAGTLTIFRPLVSQQAALYDLVLTHDDDANEMAMVTVQILSYDNSPNWVETARECQTGQYGECTGYISVYYEDMNPYSETYEQTKTELIYDPETCPEDGDYVFTFSDSTSAKTLTYNSEAGTSANINIITRRGGRLVGYSLFCDSAWMTVNKSSTSFTVTMTENMLTEDRTGHISLVQDESGYQIELTVVQTEYEPLVVNIQVIPPSPINVESSGGTFLVSYSAHKGSSPIQDLSAITLTVRNISGFQPMTIEGYTDSTRFFIKSREYTIGENSSSSLKALQFNATYSGQSSQTIVVMQDGTV